MFSIFITLTLQERQMTFCCYGLKQTPPGERREDLFPPIHKLKHALQPRKKNQVYDLLDSCGYLLLEEHFASHIQVYFTHIFF